MPENYEFFAELLVTTAATLLAAYGGAKYAFSIQNRANKERRNAEDIASGNLALFTLIRFHNTFRNIDSKMIGDMRGNPHRHHFIRPSLISVIDPPSFNYPSLSFLIESHPNILGKIAALESDIAGTLGIIAERSRIHVEILQPVVEQVEKQLAKSELGVEQVEAVLGTRTTAHLKACTEYMIQGVDRALENTRVTSDELGQALKDAYPKAKIIKIGS